MENAPTSIEVIGSTVEQKLLHALKGIRYGSVEIVIHDSRIVQIERREKLRLDIEVNGKK